jgi:hypothetical protein
MSVGGPQASMIARLRGWLMLLGRSSAERWCRPGSPRRCSRGSPVWPVPDVGFDAAHGVVTAEQVDGALAPMKSPDFVMMSPPSITVRGRVPTWRAPHGSVASSTG